MADIAPIPTPPVRPTETDVLREAVSLLQGYGFEVLTPPSALAGRSCDLLLKRREAGDQDHWYLVELKNTYRSEFIPSSSLSSCADLMSQCKEYLSIPYVTCVYSTNAKLGEAASLLSKELALTVLPEISSGSTLATALRDLATPLHSTG
jgi:hypothetical protein